MELKIFYPKGFLNFDSFRSAILLHLSEHLIFDYLLDIIKPPDIYNHNASTLFDSTYFNFSLDSPEKGLYKKVIKSLEYLTIQPTILKKYFFKEKSKLENELYLKEINSDFQLKKIFFASLIDSKTIKYNLKKSINTLNKLRWDETERFIKNNFSFKKFLILEKNNNNIGIIKYPEVSTEFEGIRLKVNFQKFNKEFPFLFVFLYHFEPSSELIFFNGLLRKAFKNFIFKDLSDKLYLYSYLDKYYSHSIQKLFTAFIIPYQNKQKLKKEILKAKERFFFIAEDKFQEFKNEFIEAINKNCFDIFRSYILNKIFKKEITRFDLEDFKKEVSDHINLVNYNQFQIFVKRLNLIFNV